MTEMSVPVGRTLILIKHALPEIDPSHPAQEWQLGETGRAQSLELAEQLRSHQPTRILTSLEAKAEETGQIIADRLNIPCLPVAGLHEQERANERYADPATFRAKIRLLFAEQDALHYGTETATAARTRFTAAINEALRRYDDPVLAVIAHGTVISLYAAPLLSRDPFDVWEALDCGDFLVIR